MYSEVVVVVVVVVIVIVIIAAAAADSRGDNDVVGGRSVAVPQCYV